MSEKGIRLFGLKAVLILAIGGSFLFAALWFFIPDTKSKEFLTELTPEERIWLDENPDRLTLFYNTEFPPVEFAGDDGEFTGLGADVVAEVERRLGIEFIKTPCEDWNLHLQSLANGQCAVAPVIVRTDDRESYAHFTVPYATVPVVIITGESSREELTLEELDGMTVAVVSGFATEEYLLRQTDVQMEIVPVRNVPQGLRAVSFGEVDAFVENLAVASWHTEAEGLSNLRVAGETRFFFDWSIGVSREYPLLFSAVQKALADVPGDDMDKMYSRWISMARGSIVSASLLGTLRIAGLFAVVLLVFLGAISLYLRRRLNEKVKNLKRTQEELLEKTERLRQAEKMEALGNLAGGIAHDFNNILQVIEGYAQLLAARGDMGQENRAGLKHIEGAARRASTLINQLMTFSRRVEFRRVPVDLKKEVDNAVEVLGHTIPKMLKITVSSAPSVPNIVADPVHIEQIIFNLVGNAMDAMADNGEIHISLESLEISDTVCSQTGNRLDGLFAVLTVSDNGPGIPLEVQRKMYDPFFTTKGAGRGTGLGLASVYGIVKQLGGCIRCSSAPGQGASFSILLPSTDEAAGKKDTETVDWKSLEGTETVLVVDDEPSITEQSKEYLSALGYRVFTASSGEEALKMRNLEDVNIVLLDLNMPGMGGYRCLHLLRRMHPELKVIIVSGHSEFDVNISGILKKSSGFLRKPYRLSELAERVREILDEREDFHSGE